MMRWISKLLFGPRRGTIVNVKGITPVRPKNSFETWGRIFDRAFEYHFSQGLDGPLATKKASREADNFLNHKDT